MDGTDDNDVDGGKPAEGPKHSSIDDDAAEKSRETPMEMPTGDNGADQDTKMKEGEENEDKESDRNGKKDVDEEGKTATEEDREADIRDKSVDVMNIQDERREEKEERGEGPKINGDEAGDEVLEAGEDTVIY